METIDCLVIGAGVVGLAVGRELALRGHEVLVLEAERAIGQHASSRNTGVIHAGFDYPRGSLKARLCRDGRDLLYAYCAEHGVAHRRLGKILPVRPGATAADLDDLRAFHNRAVANGCEDVIWLDGDAVSALEPELDAPAALHSPSSGAVDQHELMTALWGDLTNKGGHVALGVRASGGKVSPDAIEVVTSGREQVQLRPAVCVNAAGAGAQIAARAMGLPEATVPPRLLQKGSYCVFNGRSPFAHLVYPFRHGLHASLDMAGRLRFGPDAEWIEEIDYSFDENRMPKFYARIREFWPGLADGKLTPGWSAIRSKTARKSASETEFIIQDSHDHGVRGLVNLYGIESPGLTASLAIAREVASRL